MHELLRVLLVSMISLSLMACMTTRVVAQGPDASAAALQQSPALGDPKDMVIVVTADGTRHEMRLTSVDAQAVYGSSLDHKQPITIPISQIQRVEVTEVNSRAIITVAVVVLVVAVVAAVSAGRSLAQSLSTVVP